MLGTIVNVLAIIVGSTVGLLFGRGLKRETTKTIQDAMALGTIAIGIMSAIEMTMPLLVLVSLALGALIGELIGIEQGLNKFADKISDRFGEGNFSKGFVTATLVYCVGAMAIYGAIESGLTGDHNTLYIKSTLDGVTSVVFASTLGIGVLFSIIPVFIYQGSITLLAGSVSQFLTDDVVVNMSAIGGILIIGIALNILGVTKIRLANLIPALFIPVIYFLIF